MIRPSFDKLTLLGSVASLLFSTVVFADATRTALPNIIIIFCDDLGYRDLGCYGSPKIKTPNADRLAAEGIRFTDFYSAYCVCSASRASLLTGSYQPRLSMPGVLRPHSDTGLHPDEVTIADVLKTKGYVSAMIGKWHIGDSPETLPTAQGFDSYFGLPYSNDMARREGWGNAVADLDRIWREKKWEVYDNELYRGTKVIEAPVNQITLTKRYTDEALKFVRAQKGHPFFLYLAHAMPHVPLFVPDEVYDADPARAYRLTIEHIDSETGRLLSLLDELEIAGNTLVIFTSDNGPWLQKKHYGGSALPLRAGKTTTYEGGMRVPCLMRWPRRIKPGGVCRAVASTIDLLPTMAGIVGAELPADRPIDGLDVAALLDDPSAVGPRETTGFCYYKNLKLEALRLGRWKLQLRNPEKPELFDLGADISESRNLAGRHPDKVANLRRVMVAYDEELKANSRPAWRRAEGK